MSVVSLPDAKAFLNITSSAQDDEIVSMIERAEAVIARRVGPLEPVTVTDEVHTGPGPILLKKYPVVSATSATSYGATVGDLVLDADAGVLTGTFSPVSRSVLVTYVAGRTLLPADLEMAVLELVRHLWDSQRGAAQSPVAQQLVEDVPLGASHLLPYRVQSLIEPFLLPTVA